MNSILNSIAKYRTWRFLRMKHTETRLKLMQEVTQ